MALLLITHDLGVVRELCERAIVLYAGRIAEEASVDRLFADPRHPYTAGLAASNPQIASRRARLPQIPGGPPNPARVPPGCPFSPRCPAAIDRCAVDVPALLPSGEGRLTACHRSEELAAGTLRLSWEDPA
jgi:peptide/nickel transport system ATP-binding protein/oligopeptide transport system ATP-binding protein